MQDLQIEGIGKMSGGDFQKVSIDGIGECTGDIRTESIKIDGKFKCKGSLTTGLLECDGMAEFQSNILAKKVDVDGMLTVSKGTKLEAGEIDCDGYIRVDGQVSADVIRADGFISAKEIVGDSIEIHSRMGRLAKLFKKASSRVELIEATTIHLIGVTAHTVNGQNIVIGPHCVIEHLDCSGTLSIDPSSTVKTMTGSYTRE